MKAPLRFAFGWVLYVAIFCAVAPVVRALRVFLEPYPVDAVISVVAAAFAFLALWWFVLRAFWSWCDQPRRESH